MPSPTRLAAALSALSALTAASLDAQTSALASAKSAAPAAREEAPFTPRATVSVNPLGMVLGFNSAEGEARLTRSITAGASVSQFDLGWETTVGDDAGTRDDEGKVRYLSGEGKVRWYPGGDAPRGFSIAGTGGYADMRGEQSDGGSERRGHAWTAGTSLDYNWFTGSRDRVLIGAGFGVKRFLGADVRDEAETAIHGVLPTLRITVGYAF